MSGDSIFMKILIIENDPSLRDLIAETLRPSGYEMMFDSDGDDAWNLIKSRRDIRIVIAEWTMPGMDGIELCRKIRSENFPYYISIMLLTSKNHKTDLIEGIKEGADDILKKPLDVDEFLIRIHAAERIIHLEENLLEKNKRLRIANDILVGNLLSGQEAQKSLLPSGFPKISSMEFAARFIPSAFGSGDIYNIFRLDEKNIGLYNIDVSGHGVSAALFTVCLNQRLIQAPHSSGLVKIPIDEPPYYHIRTPFQVVSLLNEEDMLGKYGRFFTMVYAIVNVEIGRISFCRAGHNYPLLIHNPESSCYIEGGGPPIGLGLTFRDTVEQDMMLSPGDEIILFSDGINDAFSPKKGKRYGLKKVQQILTTHYPEPLEKAFDGLIADVQKFMGTDGFSDDISILGFRWQGH